MEIKILGSGCPKCKKLEQLARAAAEEAGVEGVEATFTKVTEMNDMMAYDIAMTPALVINEDVKCSGRIPPKHQVAAWIHEAAA